MKVLTYIITGIVGLVLLFVVAPIPIFAYPVEASLELVFWAIPVTFIVVGVRRLSKEKKVKAEKS